MDKNQNYYLNRNKYGNVCIPRREGILNYLIKEKFLSEFSTEEEKLLVLENLGIISRLKLLQQYINNKIDNIEITPAKDSIKHVFITLEEYNALESYEKDTLYLIIENLREESHFGDVFPFILG